MDRDQMEQDEREPEDPTAADEQLIGAAQATATRLGAGLATVVRGKDEEIRLVLCALACHGHVFLEDVPGTAKTVLARALAALVEGASSARIQCTPDLLPSDVSGLSIFNQKTRDFEFREGPVFANFVLVDEINRATPKTQSALLEAMAERQVTVEGQARALPRPFLILATANPVEHEGTFPLPEAQLDRFFLRTALGYPSEADELRILEDQLHGHPLAGVTTAVSLAEVAALAQAVESVYMRKLLKKWVVKLTRATRELDTVDLGASVRGTLALERAARAWALLQGRSYVVPQDVEDLFLPVVAHRVLFSPSFEAKMRTAGQAAALEEFKAAVLERAPRPVKEQPWGPVT